MSSQVDPGELSFSFAPKSSVDSPSSVSKPREGCDVPSRKGYMPIGLVACDFDTKGSVMLAR